MRLKTWMRFRPDRILARTHPESPTPNLFPSGPTLPPSFAFAAGCRSATLHGAGAASATFTGESRGLDADLYIVEVSADLEVAAP